MAKTFNRRPLSVSTPKSSEAKNYFFNHANWKGMAVDKNFLAADQETFEDCNNVYMDSEGLLRSRPAVKLKNGLTDIIKFWNFDNINVYCVKDSESYQLNFTDLNYNVLATVRSLKSDNIVPVLKDGKIFIFTDNEDFRYFDTTTKTLADATNYVYIPTVDGDGNGESINLLSDSVIKTYLYGNNLSINNEMNGKYLSYKISDETVRFRFNKDTARKMIVDKTIDLPDDTNYVMASFVYSTPIYVACGLNSDFSLHKVSVKIGDNNWNTRYSGDNIAINKGFNKLFLVKNKIGLSDDGTTLYFCSDKGLYFLTVLPDENGMYKYNTFEQQYSIADYSRVACDYHVKVFTSDRFVLAINYVDDGLQHYNNEFILKKDSATINRFMYYGNSDSVMNITSMSCTYDSTDLSYKLYVGHNHEYGQSTSLKSGIYLYTIKDGTDSINRKHLQVNIHEFVDIQGDCAVYVSDGYFYIFDVSDGTSTFMFRVSTDELNSHYLKYSRLSPDSSAFYYINRVWLKAINQVNNNLVLSDSNVIIHNFGNYSAYSAVNSNAVYSSFIEKSITLSTGATNKIDYGAMSLLSQSLWSELDSFYVGNSQLLYISEPRKNENGEFLWYFPEINEQRFNYEITGLQPISSDEMGIFFSNEVWYSSYDKEKGYYYYYRSKLQTGLLKDADITTSYDGTKVIFPSERGLVSLSYQDFVASTDQVLTYLSDAIFDKFKEFVKKPVKLLKYQHWILAYRKDSTQAYLFDVRNNSWWPLIYHSLADEFYVVENEIVLLSDGKLFGLDKSDNDYYDYDGEIHNIDWHLTSQKLHFNAVNYVKHIENLTLYAVLDSNKSVNFKMDVKNYRKKISQSTVQTISYRVDVIRTVVKKVNYFKVDEFQYIIRHDEEQAIRIPLSLSGVTIKYSIGGQVR